MELRVRKMALLALGFGLASSGAAQDVGSAIDMTGMGIYGMEDAVMEAAHGGVKRTPAKRLTAANLRYTPSTVRRRANMKAFVARLRARDPKGADDLARLFAQKDVIAEYGRVVTPLGLHAEDLADAYALWWTIAWNASRSRETIPDRSQMAAVRSQAARALGSIPGISRMTDAAKQRAAEAYMVQAMLIDGAVGKAKGDPEALKRIATSVRQGAKASGLSLDAMVLTPKGFVART